jgi:hypothetical protein
MKEPSNKKRRLDSNALAKQDSFSEILQQLEAEGDMSGGVSAPLIRVINLTHAIDHIETSAAWPRPALEATDPKKHSIGESYLRQPCV